VVSVAQHSLRKSPPPKPPVAPWPVHTEQEIRDGMMHCHELLHQLDEGLQKTLKRKDVEDRMDRWLEEFHELLVLQGSRDWGTA
jgi:hypothetical protein